MQERVVTASLRIVPEELRQGVEALFTLFAIFAEDVTVPDTALDVVAPLMAAPAVEGSSQAAAGGSSAAKQKRLVRRGLQQLLKASILKGSMEAGVSVHDLVRECMIKRAEAAREGGLRATQRDAVPLLVAAFDASSPAAAYVARSLHWHVRQARLPGKALAIHPILNMHAD